MASVGNFYQLDIAGAKAMHTKKNLIKKFIVNAAEEKNDHNYFVCSGRTFYRQWQGVLFWLLEDDESP